MRKIRKALLAKSLKGRMKAASAAALSAVLISACGAPVVPVVPAGTPGKAGTGFGAGAAMPDGAQAPGAGTEAGGNASAGAGGSGTDASWDAGAEEAWAAAGGMYDRLYEGRIYSLALLMGAMEGYPAQDISDAGDAALNGILEEAGGLLKETGDYSTGNGRDIIVCGGKVYAYSLSDVGRLLEIADEADSLYEEMHRKAILSSGSGSGSVWGGDPASFEIGAASSAPGSGGIASIVGGIASAAAGAIGGGSSEPPAAPMENGVPEPPAGPVPASAGGTDADWNTEEYSHFRENRFMSAKTSPFSTFGIDTDTASYSNLRRLIYMREHVPTDSVRAEEMINYFNYGIKKPEGGDRFRVETELSDTPWNADTKLLRVAVRAEEKDAPSAGSNIVLLVDTSGSMFDYDKLSLVQKSLLMLLTSLTDNDRVSLVTYAGDDTVRFEGLKGEQDRDEIARQIISLKSGGGTYGEAGINRAYEIAEQNFIDGGNNRVVLATDGDLNIGASSESDLVRIISEKRGKRIFLSVFGVGEGNYKDSKMKALADNGDGNFAYIDSSMEARRAMVEEFGSTMYTAAKDCKMQVEFNPAKVKGWRQIGYESRTLEAEDFADDSVDGAEVGSGSCATVLYEVVPIDSPMEVDGVQPRYSSPEEAGGAADEWLTVSIRYKEPEGGVSRLIEAPVSGEDLRPEMSDDMSWAAGVAETAMLLRDSPFKGTASYQGTYERLNATDGAARDRYRAQFLDMLGRLAGSGAAPAGQEQAGGYADPS